MTTSFMKNSSVDLANYFSPMPSSPAVRAGASAPPQSRTATIARGIQTDYDSADNTAAGWLAGSGAAAHSTTISKSYDEVTMSKGGFGGGGDSMDVMHTGTQTLGPSYYPGGQGIAAEAGGKTVASSSYSYESRQMACGTGPASQRDVYVADTVDARYLQQQQQLLLQQQQLHQQQQQQQQLLLQQQQQLQQQQLLQQQQNFLTARSPTPSDTLSVGVSGGSYQMHNMMLTSHYQQQLLQQQQQLYNSQQVLQSSQPVAGGAAAGFGTTPNLMAAEEIRVDCVKLTTNGRYVVTGSTRGPPQVWDLKNGNLVRVMAGEEFSSTDLHLTNGDTLLVGQVAELEQVDPSDVNAASRLHHRKLQIWDFETGRPLEMRKNELCTASCMMNDGEHLVLGRTDRFGGSTTIVIWDVLGNEPVRQLRHDACVGFADHISYLRLSPDDRFCRCRCTEFI
jgi:WD40 repeat protein